MVKLFIKEQESQICNKYFSREKPSLAFLAKNYNCNPTTIRDIIIRNGYKLRTVSEAKKGKNEIFTKEEKLQICKEYFSKEKPSTTVLAKKWNCSQATIRDVIIKNNFSLRNVSEPMFTKEQELEICNDYFSKEKPNTYILAEKWSCSNTTIARIIKQNGYKLRTFKDTKQKRREKALLQIQNQHGFYKDTKPELKMKEILTELNIPFEHQFKLRNHLFDFHILNTNILIEVDGDYWHSNPKIYSKLNKTQQKQKERDIKHSTIVKTNNFILLRFWESDILKNTEKVKNIIYDKINNLKC